MFSPITLAHPEAKNAGALDRIGVGKRRVQNVLDQHLVAHKRTLEQKISDQGPDGQKVDPHLLGLAIDDLLHLNRLKVHHHSATKEKPWYANPATPDAAVQERLNVLAPLYASVTNSAFNNLTGDALEVITYKCIAQMHKTNPQYAYQGHFKLDEPKTPHGRYKKIQPPKAISGLTTVKEADFIQYGHAVGPYVSNVKNYREWLYPHHSNINELIKKSADLGAIPVLISRRIHYTTIRNLLEPAGIIAHESYYQYYPADKAPLAEQVKHKQSLGFTDVTASEEPHPRTAKFFNNILPKVTDIMGARWNANKDALLAYVDEEINLAQLYNEIGSPAAGKWQDFNDQP